MRVAKTEAAPSVSRPPIRRSSSTRSSEGAAAGARARIRASSAVTSSEPNRSASSFSPPRRDHERRVVAFAHRHHQRLAAATAADPEIVDLGRPGVPGRVRRTLRAVPVPERQVVQSGATRAIGGEDVVAAVAGVAEAAHRPVREADPAYPRCRRHVVEPPRRIGGRVSLGQHRRQQQGSGAERNRFGHDVEVHVVGRAAAPGTVERTARPMRIVVARDQVPGDRVLRPHALERRAEQAIARHVGVPYVARDHDQGHAFRAGQRSHRVDRVEPGFREHRERRVVGEAEHAADLPIGTVDEPHAAFCDSVGDGAIIAAPGALEAAVPLPK